jgi:hypothetical protein
MRCRRLSGTQRSRPPSLLAPYRTNDRSRPGLSQTALSPLCGVIFSLTAYIDSRPVSMMGHCSTKTIGYLAIVFLDHSGRVVWWWGVCHNRRVGYCRSCGEDDNRSNKKRQSHGALGQLENGEFNLNMNQGSGRDDSVRSRELAFRASLFYHDAVRIVAAGLSSHRMQP